MKRYMLPIAMCTMMTGCNLTGTSLIGVGGASPAPTSAPATSATLKKNLGVAVPIWEDSTYHPATVLRSTNFDLSSGTYAQTANADFGQVEFASMSGLGMDGWFVFGRKGSQVQVDVGFIDAGNVPFESVREAPEVGWAVGSGANRAHMAIASGKVILVRAIISGTTDMSYGKVMFKELLPIGMIVDCAWQTTPGNRALE